MSEQIVLSGNEAIARGVWEAGVSFASAYPGTPSSEILPALKQLGECYLEWAVNEKCSLEAAAGATLTGARCLVTMKHVGLNVAADPFFTLSYTGVNGGIVIVCADDPNMHSSQNEQDNRHYSRAAKVPMLEPSDSQECLDYAKLALALSEEFDTPMLLRTTTRVNHSDGIVTVDERHELERPCEPVRDPKKYVMIPAWARQRQQVLHQRTHKIQEWAETAAVNRLEMRDTKIGVITSGVAYQYVREVMPEASVLKLGLTWPLPPKKIADFAASVETLFVIEELEPFLQDQVRALGIKVVTLPESLQMGELNPDRVAAAFRGEDFLPAPQNIPPRPPVLCPGCPHRGVFMTLRKLKAYVTGDIGCYTLGALPPLSALDTCLCMGGGIGMAHGIEAACDEKRREVAVIGDSTFMHSGITGLINIAYNGGKSVVIVLDNSTTAMTGGQDHPGTGVTLSGKPGKRLDIPALCRAAGIEHVEIINPRDLKALEASILAAMERDAPSVIVTQCPCVLITRERGKLVRIDEDKCIQCGLCLRIGCPAINSRETDNPKKPQPVIDPSLCMGCHLCLQTCPKQAIEVIDIQGAQI